MAFTSNSISLNAVPVQEGGTGDTSFLVGSILIGDGTSAVNQLALTNGQFPYGQTGSDPVATNFVQGTGISINYTAPNLTISATGGAGTVTSITAGTGLTATATNPITSSGTIALTVPVVVSSGGTGATSLTSNGFLFGAGTSAVTSSALTDGQIWVGSTGSAAVATAIGSGTGITVANGSGSVAVNLNIPVVVSSGGTGAITLTSHGILLGNGTSAVTASAALTNGQLLMGSTGNAPVAATISPGTNINVTNASGSITISATGAASATIVDQTGLTVTMAPFTTYIVDNASLVTLTLPATASVGDRYTLIGKGTGAWTVAQNSGQQINFGTVATTSGATGSLSASNRYDCIEITCITANTTFNAHNVQGNITYV